MWKVESGLAQLGSYLLPKSLVPSSRRLARRLLAGPLSDVVSAYDHCREKILQTTFQYCSTVIWRRE